MKKGPCWAPGLFLAAEGALYLWFLWGDMAGRETRWVKYLSIVLYFLFTLWGAARSGHLWIPAALAFTLGADAFLLVEGRRYALGVALFCGAHLCYGAELDRNGTGWRRVPGWSAAVGALVWLWRKDLCAAAAAVYAVLLVSNALSARRGRGTGGKLLFWGLVLLLCCDVCVAVHNLPGLFPAGLYGPAQAGMWLFYLPSQVCIALSAQSAREKRRER